ncbi:MAG: hypothetical protein EKK56_07835 [Flavobacteriaceae bacterium]|nr:MAG: hypothetical protein EKK56_07835 [Flavobacteriaceae bacterium]
MKLASSGLYEKPFFTIRHIDSDYIFNNYDNIEYNMDLFIDYYCDEEEVKTREELEDIAREIFDNTFVYNYYYEVEEYNYNEEDAFKCNLVPFKFYENDEPTYLLSLAGYGQDFSPRLDAYFFLQTGKMDPSSRYFRDLQWFKYMVNEDIFNLIENNR